MAECFVDVRNELFTVKWLLDERKAIAHIFNV